MIRFKLKEVLAQKNMTMAHLSSQTGISKNTLSLLGKGASQGIQFETLNKILNETNASVSDLFDYYPDHLLDSFNITVNAEKETYDLDATPEDRTLNLFINAYLFQTMQLTLQSEDMDIHIHFNAMIHYFQTEEDDTIYCVIESELPKKLQHNLLIQDVFLKNYIIDSVQEYLQKNVPAKIIDYVTNKNHQQLPIKYTHK